MHQEDSLVLASNLVDETLNACLDANPKVGVLAPLVVAQNALRHAHAAGASVPVEPSTNNGADVADPRCSRGRYCLRPVSLRDCDNGDFLPMPSPRCRSIDSLSDGRDSSAQLRKKHSLEI